MDQVTIGMAGAGRATELHIQALKRFSGVPVRLKTIVARRKEQLEEADLNEAWNQAVIFMQSLQENEIFDDRLSSENILHRLYHSDGLEITKQREYAFACRCQREKLLNTLHTMTEKDIDDMCENGKITATCHFCGTTYSFEKGEILAQ